MPRYCFLTSLITLLVLAGCAGGGVTTDDAAENVHPGFDTWRYPGDDALATWRDASPYRWTGYYLPAPCRRDSSWVGQRSTIERLGWGMAVLYVGQQMFEGASTKNDLPQERIICSKTLLTPERGRTDAYDAAAEAYEEGFQPGTIIYLDVERASAVSDSMKAYYRAWTDELLRNGRYRPGTYAHRINADELFAVAEEVYREHGRAAPPPFWIAGTGGFALDRPPAAVGLPYARVWQGALDVRRSWGGVTLDVDENVAASPSPSTP